MSVIGIRGGGRGNDHLFHLGLIHCSHLLPLLSLAAFSLRLLLFLTRRVILSLQFLGTFKGPFIVCNVLNLLRLGGKVIQDLLDD